MSPRRRGEQIATAGIQRDFGASGLKADFSVDTLAGNLNFKRQIEGIVAFFFDFFSSGDE